MSRETRNLIREALLRQAHEEDRAMAKNIERLLYHSPEELKAMADDEKLTQQREAVKSWADSLYTRATYWKDRAERSELELSDRKKALEEARHEARQAHGTAQALERRLTRAEEEAEFLRQHPRGADVERIKALERQVSEANERAATLAERLSEANAKLEHDPAEIARMPDPLVHFVALVPRSKLEDAMLAVAQYGRAEQYEGTKPRLRSTCENCEHESVVKAPPCLGCAYLNSVGTNVRLNAEIQDMKDRGVCE